MDRIQFFRESIKNLKSVGTLTRSSRYLCLQMIRPIDFNHATCLVELGGGDGVVTKHILKKMRSDARLYTFELNEQFCEVLQAIDDDRLVVLQEDVAGIKDILAKYDIDEVDAIVSAIPFVIFPEDKAYSIITTCKDLLKKTGVFTQIHYSLFLKKLYKRTFESLKIRFVPINVPPAFVFACRKQ